MYLDCPKRYLRFPKESLRYEGKRWGGHNRNHSFFLTNSLSRVTATRWHTSWLRLYPRPQSLSGRGKAIRAGVSMDFWCAPFPAFFTRCRRQISKHGTSAFFLLLFPSFRRDFDFFFISFHLYSSRSNINNKFEESVSGRSSWNGSDSDTSRIARSPARHSPARPGWDGDVGVGTPYREKHEWGDGLFKEIEVEKFLWFYKQKVCLDEKVGHCKMTCR